jgi:hypothetical protein
METVKAYRFENSEGIGPYISSFDPENVALMNFKSRLHDAHRDNYTHPGMRFDISLPDYLEASINQFVCACDTIENLLHWFDGFVDDLKEHNFNLIEYTVNKELMLVGDSKRQVFFDKKFAIESKVVEL